MPAGKNPSAYNDPHTKKMPQTTKHGGMSPSGEKCKAMCPSDGKTGSKASKGPKMSSGRGGY